MRNVYRIFGLLPLATCAALQLSVPTVARQAPGDPPSNLSILDSLAASCIESFGDTPHRFILQTEPAASFLRPALLTSLLSREREVYVDAPLPQGLPRLSVALDASRIVYRNADRQRLERTVDLYLRGLLQDGEGRAVREDVCRRTFTDLVPERALDEIESSSRPVSHGERPTAGLRRRWLEPALFTTALGTIVYLFFSIRSRAGD